MVSSEEQIVGIIVIALGIVILMSAAIIAFFYFSRKKIIKTELEKASMEIEHQKEVIQSTLITQEEERKRIAQDLHDAISSKLNVVSLNANFLTEADISSQDTNTIGKQILSITSTILESSRKIAHDLLPPTFEKFGLKAALEELCDEVGETKKFQIRCDLPYAEGFLPPEKELHVFRIVQELFNNAIKHSEATVLQLTVKTEQNRLSLQYKDDGKGFDPDTKTLVKGIGMSGITNRVAILNGTLSVDSRPGDGVQLTIKIER
ncbi:sensor histidine kinase [Altibacter sp.]|uniref:sensor histidine kinase n=1 Tax=Altibacter sp. TaxID=2024823 RepID=UPI000C91EC79|nr:sensor histidine kinase [Altibacter sp.]MAP54618.1 two-component sensor histidine kinase [Altibacter sp.]